MYKWCGGGLKLSKHEKPALPWKAERVSLPILSLHQGSEASEAIFIKLQGHKKLRWRMQKIDVHQCANKRHVAETDNIIVFS
jgi:hypothetical protein